MNNSAERRNQKFSAQLTYIEESSDHNVVNESHKKIAINIANFGGDV